MDDFKFNYEYGGYAGKGFFESIAEWLDYPRRLKEKELKNQEEIIKLLKERKRRVNKEEVRNDK